MILLLVGATDAGTARVREAAASQSIDVRIGASSNPPDWVMTATARERAGALRQYGLSSHRVVELRDLGTAEGPPCDVIRTALVRMSEIGPLPPSPPSRISAMAARAIPVLTDWATWLAADDVRRQVAAHRSFAQSQHRAAFKGQMLFAVPDTQAVVVLRGLLDRLSREGHKVRVVTTRAAPGDPAAASYQGRGQGLRVSGPPGLDASVWRPLSVAVRECLHAWRRLDAAGGGVPAFESAVRRASPLGTRLARSRLLRSRPLRATARRVVTSIERALPLELDLIGFFEHHRPDVLILAPYRLFESHEADYIRTARWLGIATVCLPLRWDDLETCDVLRSEAPDVVAVWNDLQRRTVMQDYRLPADRVRVTGALLPSDITDGAGVDRDAYSDRMNIDRSRRILLFEAPAISTPAWTARFQE